MALYAGSQWEVTRSVIRALPPERYEFAVGRLNEIEDWGKGLIYTWIPHLAEKEWVDLDDFIDVFSKAWDLLGARAPGTLDEVVFQRSIRQARSIRSYLGIS